MLSVNQLTFKVKNKTLIDELTLNAVSYTHLTLPTKA